MGSEPGQLVWARQSHSPTATQHWRDRKSAGPPRGPGVTAWREALLWVDSVGLRTVLTHRIALCIALGPIIINCLAFRPSSISAVAPIVASAWNSEMRHQSDEGLDHVHVSLPGHSYERARAISSKRLGPGMPAVLAPGDCSIMPAHQEQALCHLISRFISIHHLPAEPSLYTSTSQAGRQASR